MKIYNAVFSAFLALCGVTPASIERNHVRYLISRFLQLDLIWKFRESHLNCFRFKRVVCFEKRTPFIFSNTRVFLTFQRIQGKYLGRNNTRWISSRIRFLLNWCFFTSSLTVFASTVVVTAIIIFWSYKAVKDCFIWCFSRS